MQKRIKIAVLLDSYNVGGSAKVVIQNLKFIPSELSAFVILFKRKGTALTELELHLKKCGINFISIPEFCAFDPFAIIKVIRILKRESVDLLESNHYKTHIIGLLAAKLFRIPWIAVSHGWTAENFKVRVYNLLDRFTLPFCTVCIATGPSIAAKLKEFIQTNKRPRCLPTAFDPSELPLDQDSLDIKIGKAEFGLTENDFIFGTIGRLSFEKGFDIFLNACKILSERQQPFKAVLVGSGPEQNKLTEQSIKFGLEKKIFFVGQISAAEAISYYRYFDCLVIPSRSEGMPNVLLEAAYFKIPTIAADVGGIPDMMVGSLGHWVFKANDSEKLADLMQSIINLSKSERYDIGIQLHERMNSKYLASQRTRRVHRLYRAVYRMKCRRVAD